MGRGLLKWCEPCRRRHAGLQCAGPQRAITPANAPRAVTSRMRIERLPWMGHTAPYCMDCSVGTRDNPIPRHVKRPAEFVIKVGKHGETPLCRDCAMQFAEDFASQLETLIGVDTDTL